MPKFNSYALSFPMTLTIFLLTVVIALSIGASSVYPWNFWLSEDHLQMIFFDIRLPRVIVAGVCGGALALAGVVSQGLFRNPLAGPSILGTTSGANVCVVLAMYLGLAQDHWLLPPFIAFFGACISTFIVIRLALSRFFVSGERLLLAGFAINSLFTAITTFILSLSLNEYGLSQSIIYWLLGGCNGKGWHHVYMGLPWLMVGIYSSLRLAAQLNVLNLGEDVARSLSVEVKHLRLLCIISLSILVACAVALCGGIGFVGLIVPHFTRLYVGSEHRKLMIHSTLNGASLLIAADTFARNILLPQELQVGAIISLIGAPLFIILLIAQRRRQES